MTEDFGRRSGTRSVAVHDTGQLTSVYLGTCEMHDRPVRHDGEARPVTHSPGHYYIWCPVREGGASGHWIKARRLVAVTSHVTCDGACMSARGPSCDCGCGGMNHGKSWGTKATRTEFEDALRKYRDEQKRTEAKREQRAEARQRQARRDYDSWAAGHAELLAALEAHKPSGLEVGANSFLADIARQALMNGKILTDGQVSAAERVLRQTAERAARKAAQDAEIAARQASAKPCPEGKVTVQGEIVKVKASEGYMPDSIRFQAIVASPDGYAVMITLPRDIEQYAMNHRRAQIWEGYDERSYGGTDWDDVSRRWTNALRGVKVTCAAQVEQSRKDPSFGFGKRPTKVTFEPVPEDCGDCGCPQ